MLSKTAIVFRTHKFDELAKENYMKLALANLSCDILYDSTNREKLDSAWNFTQDDFKKWGYVSVLDRTDLKLDYTQNAMYANPVYFNCEYAVIQWYLEQEVKPEFVWSIEYDVNFNGSWNYFFSQFESDKSDFLATWNASYPEKIFDNSAWNWYNFECPDYAKIITFGPIHRYSGKLIEAAHEHLKSGKHQFYEQTMGTVARLNDMTIKDINSIFYCYDFMSFCGVMREHVYNQAMTDNKHNNFLFHPIR